MKRLYNDYGAGCLPQTMRQVLTEAVRTVWQDQVIGQDVDPRDVHLACLEEVSVCLCALIMRRASRLWKAVQAAGQSEKEV